MNSIYSQAKGVCSVCGESFSTHLCRRCLSNVENSDLVAENQQLRRWHKTYKKEIERLEKELERMKD